MIKACRESLVNVLGCQQLAHAGLLLAKYLKQQSDIDSRKILLNMAASAAFDPALYDLYKKAYERWQAATSRDCQRHFEVNDRMIAGLGASNVLETGITLHHTYGVPYIPGSSLKGLCSHYCDEVLGELDKKFKCIDKKKDCTCRDKNNCECGGELHAIIFGNTDSCGCIDFHDAWITPESLKNGCLLRDVMTPHHAKYYEGGSPPTEYDSPNPVSFLSVSGKFLIMLSCRDESSNAKKLISLVWKILGLALQNAGIGGKTAGGYGFGKLESLEQSPQPVNEPPAPQQPVRETLIPGKSRKRLIRCSKEEARSQNKAILFKDEEDRLCIVRNDDVPAVKQSVPQDGTIELIFLSEQKQGEQDFLMFRLPTEDEAN